jgi:energy-coupling factor transport system substrate-specific component
MSWPLAAYGLLGLALAAGLGWYERSRPDARIVALVGTLAAFAALGRIAFAAVPNVKPTSDIVLVAGFALGAGPGFAVGAIAGLTSNFFFGQGPWTPWQMAAWGATGVLGAVLARGCAAVGSDGDRPAIGRWPLAIVCAAAGFAFTAVQDVGDWVTFSSHSLAALGVYVGSGLGFDALYAVSCAGFALAFGPALLRAVQRFARRIEVTWVPLPESVDRIASVLLLAGLAGAALLGPGADRARAAQPSPAAVRAVHYLERAQNSDGGLGQAPGEPSAQLFAGWAALGLASAGVDVGMLRAGTGDRTLLAYVAAGAGTRDLGSLERTILVVRAAGGAPTAVDGHDLVAELVRGFAADGAVQGQVNLTAFGLLALRAANVASTATLQARAARWLAGQSDHDGGYNFEGRGGQSEADDTGSVLEAFGTERSAAVARARRRAVAFLRHDVDGDGGFADAAGAGSNAQSTAWAIQGLIAAGVGPGSVRRDGHTPLSYLSSLVTPSGAVRYARDATQTPVWVTGEALMALTGTPLPLAPAATGTGRASGTAGGADSGAVGTTGGADSGARRGTSRPAAARAHGHGTASGSRRHVHRRVPVRRASQATDAVAVGRAVRRMETAVSALPGTVLEHAQVR